MAHVISADRVSVIVPVHGWAPYLAQTLDAVLGQTPAPGEVIVVDDGSGTPVVLHPDQARCCTLLHRGQRGGPAAARAAGLAAATGELIALCDADDAWHEGFLGAALAALARYPQAAVCFGRALIIGPDDRPTGERWVELTPGLHSGPSLVEDLYHGDPIPLSGSLMRRRALEEAGGLASELPVGEDWDMFLRLARSGAPFVFEPSAVVHYRRRPDAATSRITEVALGARAVHERHADVVSRAAVQRARSRDLIGEARGLIRHREYTQARRRLGEAAATGRPGGRVRLLAVALRVPLARSLLGRRSPYP